VADLAELERRLALLEDERSVLRRLYAYGHAIDYGDEEAWANCFAENGVFDIRSRLPGRPQQVVSGRDAIRAFVSRHTRAPELWHKHMLVEPVIAIDGDTARSDAYFAVLMDHEESPVLRVFGRYRDRLVRDADGEWRFLERIAEIESMRAGLPPSIDGRGGPR
jgi:ketosteroid isomerase-like protein